MKKSLLFSAAIATASAAFAAAPSLAKADFSAFSAAQNVTAKQAAAAPQTRAGEMETMDFTYALGVSGAYSLNNTTAGKTRVYVGFEMTQEAIQMFKGSKVTGFNVLSPTGDNGAANTITDARFFYSFDLTKEDYSQDFKMTTTSMDYNKVAMDEPYVITGEEEALIFGYSFIVKKDMYYLITDGVANIPEACIYGSSNTDAFPGLQGFYTAASDIGAINMSITLERETLPQYVSFASVPSMMCLPLGQPSSLPVTLYATSGAPVESVTLEYTLGGEQLEYTYSSADPLPAGVNRALNVAIDFPAQNEKFKEEVEFKLTKINGHVNECSGSTAKAMVAVVNEVPVHQTLMEEYTSTGCPWCTRGFAALEYIKKNYPDFVVASFHTNYGTADPMQVVTTFPSQVGGYPAAVLNRSEEVDPYYGTQTYMNMTVPIVGDILALNAVPTTWSVKVSHDWESENVLVAKAEVANMVGYEDQEYRIAYLLVADGLTGRTASWYQSNNYASQSPNPSYAEELNAFCRGGVYGKSRVAGLVFNDVVVSGTGIYGVDGSVPTSLEAEVAANHSISFDLSKISSTLIPDRQKLRVIAAVVNEQGVVLNCAKDEVNDLYDPSAVEGLIDENAPAEYYNLNGMKVAQPADGIFIRRQGGKAEKVIIK